MNLELHNTQYDIRYTRINLRNITYEIIREICKTRRFYFNRALGSNCYNCIIDGDIDASTTASQGSGKGNGMSVERETVGAYLSIVR
ncbi:unnamed protein product [marine sediment metagenome]|uniref:Uncharacterized protein n=1 Tax=marine sediment metagenome TaxID=412755 RepID=X1LGK2_9ZZZZ